MTDFTKQYEVGDRINMKGEGNWTNLWKSSLNFVQFMIKLTTLSRFSHIAIVYDVKPHCITIFEATDKGTVMWDDDTYYINKLKTGKAFLLRNRERLSDKQKKSLQNFLLKHLGKDYDYKGILSFFLNIFRKTQKFKLEGENEWFCSEISAKADDYLGFEIVPGKKPDEISPGDYNITKVYERILLR